MQPLKVYHDSVNTILLMLRVVSRFIEKRSLLSLNRPVVVGLSGGADSVALLAVLVRLGYDCVALHCNFHLRGDESLRDEEFSRSFAKRLGVTFHKVDFDTAEYAAVHHLSIEMAARELRYDWFEKMRLAVGAQAVAVAHHRDDSVETLLMNMLRGSGVRGLGGIRARNGNVVRPLLCLSREEIVEWISAQGYNFVVDSTNMSDAYTRNFIRLRVLPLLEELNPAVRTTLARTADHISAAGAIYSSVVERAKSELVAADGSISINMLVSYPAPEAILFEILRDYGFSRSQSDDVFDSLNGESGRSFYSSTHRLLKDRERLIVVSLEENGDDLSYQIDIESGIIDTPLKLSLDVLPIDSDFSIVRDKNIAYFDCDKVKEPLMLRHWREGDWFVPFGMRGRKKLSDYFSDHKFSLLDKERAWLLCGGNDILWLVGERSDDRYRIDNSSKRALVVKFMG